MNHIPKISWKVIRKPHDSEDINIEFDGDKINATKYYEKVSKKKMKAGSVIALIDPKGTSVSSRHANEIQIDELKLKKITIKSILTIVLLVLFVFLTIYNLHDNIFVSNSCFLASIGSFVAFIFYGIKFLKNKRKTVYINI